MSVKTRKIINRSGNAECEICKSKVILERHHIFGRDIPNAEHKFNIANICPTCHTEVHYGKIIVEGWFQTTGGMKLIWHLKDDECLTGIEAKPHQVLK